MKNVIVFFLIVGLASCKSQEKKSTTFEDVSVAQFQKMIGKDGAQLIDVRTPKEYENGHLKNARLINYMAEDFKTKAFEGLDKSKPVLVYCASGGRSASSAEIYIEAGFTKVYNLLGGIRAWKAENLELEK